MRLRSILVCLCVCTVACSKAFSPAAEPLSAASSDGSAQRLLADVVAARHPRVLFITAADSVRCAAELARLRTTGGEFDKLKSCGWKIGAGPENDLQIVERDEIPKLLSELTERDFPAVVCVSHGEIVRSFTSGCTTPLDAWTFGWLAKGIDERPPAVVLEAARVASTGSYPLRGNHWSVDGDWNPGREVVISHLRSSNHGVQLSTTWRIESWSYEELRSLHDDLHERYGGGVVSGTTSSRGRSSSQFSASRKAAG